jgi:tetratricopeptide (TPR) repeat protein
LAANPDDYYPRYYRARAYEIIGKAKEAKADFKFLAEAGNGEENLVAKAKLNAMLELESKSPKFEPAKRAENFLTRLTKVIDEYPRSGLARTVLGEFLVEQEKYDKAYPYLLQVQKLQETDKKFENPLIGSAYRDLGFIHNSRRDYGNAKQCFTKALERHETMTHAHLGLAQALIGLGRQSEAEPHLARAAELNPSLYHRSVVRAASDLDLNERTAKKVASLGNRKYFMPKEYGGQPNENIWYVKDTAGHAQCRYKVYIEHSGHLNFLYGADESGKRIDGKHESRAGTSIPVKDLSIKKNT